MVALLLVLLVAVAIFWSSISSTAKNRIVESMDIVILPENQALFLNQSIISDSVQSIIGNPSGRSASDINIQKLEARLNKIPAVRKAEVYIALDGILKIKIEERTPVVLVQNVNEQEFYLDSTRDAFGKLRTTFPTTLLDNKFPSSAGTTEYKSNNMIDCYKSTGSTSFTYGNSKVILTATGSGSATSQSRKYCVYQPGKSILILLSGVINASSNTADCITRLGYFDDNNGLFFQYTNNTMSVVLRNTGVEDIKINQTSWNIDKMDGTGVSSISLDFTKSQLYVIDFEWLSVGRIRFGFYLFGKINYCHQITNLNSLTAPYMLSPNLPSRYQILSTSGATGTLTQICTTVISEGGYTPIGRAFSAGTNPNTSVSVPTTETPIIAITGISTYNHENILPISFTIMDTDNNNGYLYRLRLYLSPTGASSPLNGATVVNVNDNSVVAYSISGLTIPAGSIIVDQGYFYGRGIVSFNSLSDVFTNIIQITSNIDNVSDVLLLTAEKTGTTGAGNVFASISWQEIY